MLRAEKICYKKIFKKFDKVGSILKFFPTELVNF